MNKAAAKTDDAQNALRIVETVIGEPLIPRKPSAHHKRIGHLGGLKGGNSRAKHLSSSRRHEIAKKAAAARWSKTR